MGSDKTTKMIEALLRQMGRMGLLDNQLTDHELEALLDKAVGNCSPDFKQRALDAMRAAQAKRDASKANAS